jgi:hypothetical protein
MLPDTPNAPCKFDGFPDLRLGLAEMQPANIEHAQHGGSLCAKKEQ